MSKLIVEVCVVDSIRDHPNADLLEIAKVKGWEVCIGKGEFKAGSKLVYIPYDAVLPPELANGPDDDPPGRLNVMKYCAPLPKNQEGHRPPGGRVRATRLRGERSFGIPMPILDSDPGWEVGTSVAEYFGITKWEPVVNCPDAETPHPRFHSYTDIEHFGNFPEVICPGEDVVMTEKIHGKTCRLGLVLDQDEDGNADWTWMAGSHAFRRKELFELQHKFDAVKLLECACVVNSDVVVGQVIENRRERLYRVDEVLKPRSEKKEFLATRVDPDGNPMVFKSEFWGMMTPQVKALLIHLRDKTPWPQTKAGIVIFGEIYGRGVQDMEYGMTELGYRAFDIAVNGQYLGYVHKSELFRLFDVTQVPVIYRGPFSEEHRVVNTDGPTKLCKPKQAGRFSGREGVVIAPTLERFSDELNGRVILKSVSDLYAQRSGATDNVD